MNKHIMTDIITIKVELTQAGKTKEWSGDKVASGYALTLLKSAEAELMRFEPQGVIEDTQMECNACGHSVDPNDNYCSNCGEWQEK